MPAGSGYETPLYENPLFRRLETGPAGCPVSCPYHGGAVEYAAVRCPVCEQVCRDTCWIPQHVLLAGEAAMESIAAAVQKVCANLAREGIHGQPQGVRGGI